MATCVKTVHCNAARQWSSLVILCTADLPIINLCITTATDVTFGNRRAACL